MKKTVTELFKEASVKLSENSIEEAKFEAAQLIQKHFNYNRAELFIKGAEQVSQEKESAFFNDLKQRLGGRPLQYILGKWEFYSLPFFVGEGVLVPRPDTEVLVDEAIKILKKKTSAIVAELCSGSGCIAIAAAVNVKDIKIFAFEKYDAAFGYLQRNIELNSVKNITPVKADVLHMQPQKEFYDLILSNPPYVPVKEIKTLSREVQNEPFEALAAEEEGLEFYRGITALWLESLKPGGDIIFEVGNGQSEDVKKIIAPYFKEIIIKSDLGGIQRVIIGTHKI